MANNSSANGANTNLVKWPLNLNFQPCKLCMQKRWFNCDCFIRQRDGLPGPCQNCRYFGGPNCEPCVPEPTPIEDYLLRQVQKDWGGTRLVPPKNYPNASHEQSAGYDARNPDRIPPTWTGEKPTGPPPQFPPWLLDNPLKYLRGSASGSQQQPRTDAKTQRKQQEKAQEREQRAQTSHPQSGMSMPAYGQAHGSYQQQPQSTYGTTAGTTFDPSHDDGVLSVTISKQKYNELNSQAGQLNTLLQQRSGWQQEKRGMQEQMEQLKQENASLKRKRSTSEDGQDADSTSVPTSNHVESKDVSMSDDSERARKRQKEKDDIRAEGIRRHLLDMKQASIRIAEEEKELGIADDIVDDGETVPAARIEEMKRSVQAAAQQPEEEEERLFSDDE